MRPHRLHRLPHTLVSPHRLLAWSQITPTGSQFGYIVELLAPTLTRKLFATGRPSDNRAPAAAKTLLSTWGQTPKSMKKPFLILSTCSNPPCSAPKACRHQKDAYSPQHELQSDLKATTDIIKNRYFWLARDSWRVKVGLPWSKRRQWHKKTTKVS